MEIDVIVPVRRQATVQRLLTSLSFNTVLPHAVILVSNDLDGSSLDPCGLNVRLLRFESKGYPIGSCDAALRRNLGIWASDASHVLTFDDDQIAPADLIQSAQRVLGTERYCWGHHRFIDFGQSPLDHLAALPPEAGRTREMPPNAWHSWRSAYAGLFAADRRLLQQVGGFDMMFSGRHGGEDQYLARRLAKVTHDSEAIFVHEPPFAWHPEQYVGWDAPRDSNICAGPHQVVQAEIQGVATHGCARCPFYWVPDETIMSGNTSMPFDVSLTFSRIENFGTAPKAFNEVFGFGLEACRAAATTGLEKAYEDYVQRISSPDMAISLEMAAFLSALCERQLPGSILDLGSGFSSFVFRAYAETHPAAVWSVDDDPTWLERTKQFLTARLLPTNNMALWREADWREEPFDLICYDLGGMMTRAQTLAEVLQRMGETTILVLDDMHKEEYFPSVERELRAGRWRYFDARSYTMDHYGRFCGVVLRAAHPLVR